MIASKHRLFVFELLETSLLFTFQKWWYNYLIFALPLPEANVPLYRQSCYTCGI